MTLDEALGGDPDRIGDPGQALFVLRQEVRRLRAGVEAVRALPRLLFVNSNGWMLNRDDVLAALDGGADD